MEFSNHHNIQDTNASCFVNFLSGVIYNDAEVIECFPTDVQADITDDALTDDQLYLTSEEILEIQKNQI